MTQNQNNQPRSLLKPVGIASPLTGTPNWTMAVFEKDLVPEGTELFVQPSDSRLCLEVEVSNDNAMHWKDRLEKANAHITQLKQRAQLAENKAGLCQLFIEDLEESGLKLEDDLLQTLVNLKGKLAQLFVQPSESRLEVEVSNENAPMWKKRWATQTDFSNKILRQLGDAKKLLQQVEENGAHPAFLKEINEFLSKE